MVEEYWGLKEKPFLNTADPRFTYRSDDFNEAYARIVYNISEIGGGLTLITGEIGCGKTFLANAIKNDLEQAGHRVILITNPIFTQAGFLRWILEGFLEGSGIKVPRYRVKMLSLLESFLRESVESGIKCVTMIDEAQILKPKVLEEIRLLLNLETEKEKLLQIVLLGQPEMEKKIEKMPQVRQRINVRFFLGALDREETIEYINHRLKVAGAEKKIFTDGAVDKIYKYSRGIPRNINNLCQNALFAGYSMELKKIDKDIIDAVAEDLRMV